MRDVAYCCALNLPHKHHSYPTVADTYIYSTLQHLQKYSYLFAISSLNYLHQFCTSSSHFKLFHRPCLRRRPFSHRGAKSNQVNFKIPFHNHQTIKIKLICPHHPKVLLLFRVISFKVLRVLWI